MIQPSPGFQDEALAVDSVIMHEQGQWVVYLDVIFWDETVRRRIQTYPSKQQADVAARWMKRAAQRNLPQAPTGEE